MAITKKNRTDNSPAYVVCVRDAQNRWFPRKTFDRMVDAERYERELLNLRDTGKLAVDTELRELTVHEYWSLWSEQCRGNVSLGWKLSQDQMYRDYIEPVIGGVKLLQLRSHHIGQCISGAEQAKRSRGTCRHVYTLLHKIFEDAVEHFEFIDLNPVKRRWRPRLHRTARKFLTPAESRAVLAAARSLPHVGPAIWIALLAGMRTGEIQALRWQHIDFANRQILIEANYARKEGIIRQHPKQGHHGKVPLPPDLSEFLAGMRREAPADAFVVTGEEGGMLSHNAFLRGIRRLCTDLGVTAVTPHELRHSCTELYIEAGASVEDIRRLLNHSSTGVTQGYIHRTDDRLNALAASVSARPRLASA